MYYKVVSTVRIVTTALKYTIEVYSVRRTTCALLRDIRYVRVDNTPAEQLKVRKHSKTSLKRAENSSKRKN